MDLVLSECPRLGRLSPRACLPGALLARLRFARGGFRALRRLAELRREYGREREPFEIHVISADAYRPDGIERLAEAGVTDVIVGFRNAYGDDTMTLQQKIDALKGFADSVISKVR